MDKKLKIAVVNVLNSNKNVAMNKDLNGGFGTADTYSNTIFEKIISLLKKRSIKLPIISLAYLMGILKQKNIYAKYYEGLFPEKDISYDVILIYGSIVDYKNENKCAKIIKETHPEAKVGFIGPFPSTMPLLFSSVDFVLQGSFEKFFLQDFNDVSKLTGVIEIAGLIDMNKLPSPELDGFPVAHYGYSPAISAKPFFAMQSSLGCPYSCSYYCVYGKTQGAKVVVRSPEKVVKDIIYLQDKYGIKGIQFRDPTFGIKPGYIEAFCQELEKQEVKVKWGIETRTDLLNADKIKLMFDAGLRNINIGIETIDPEIAKKNKRNLISVSHQEKIIKYAEKLGVKISAFYIFGYENDTMETMRNTLEYAKRLNTFLARFAIVTPYPGTEFYQELKSKNRLLSDNLEDYTQFKPVIKHNNLSSGQISQMLSSAFKEYYFRPKYVYKFFIWKIREFWL